MKRRFLYVLCSLLIGSLLLSGCGKKDISARMEGLTDPRGSIPFDQRSYGDDDFLETSFADYYVMQPKAGILGFIQVQPKGSNTFVPLCSKPNCMHNDENCNAVCIHGGGLGYCNNRLYTVANEMGDYIVVSMLPDGTDRKTEVKIPSPLHPDGTTGGAYQFVFHENWLLELYMPWQDLPLEEQVERLFVIDLTTNSITEPFSDFFTSSVSLAIIHPVGKTVYTEAFFRNNDGTTEGWKVAMNMDTGEVKKLFPCDGAGGYTVEDDIIYYLQPGDGFMEYDLRTGKMTSRGLPIPGAVGEMRLDGELIYAVTNVAPENMETWEFTMYFLNRDYEVLDQIHLGSGTYLRYIDEEFFYFTGSDRSKLMCRLNKSAIGTGNLKLIPLE